MIFKKTALVLLALTLSLPAFAQPPVEQEYFQSTELLSETSRPLVPGDAVFRPGPDSADQKVIVIPAALIVMAGAKAWSVIVNGRPSADLASAYASAIPGFDFNWEDLSGWKKVTKKYRFTMDNKIQGRAVDIVYEVSFFHGAIPLPGGDRLRNGHYITNFIIKPEVINLKWGWQVSLDALMSHPMNIGTADGPVAMLSADLKWQYAKPFSTTPKIGMHSIAIDGMGNLNEQASDTLSISPLPQEGTRDDQAAAAITWN
jgi:hypothetical protein